MGKSNIFRGLLIFFILATACNGSNKSETPELVIFSAISFSDVILDTQEYFQSKENVKLSFNFSGSQVLASQIANGAPVDLFISSGMRPVEYLLDKDLLLTESISYVTSNKLVIAISNDSYKIDINEVRDLYNLDRIVIADPEYAPAGIYAQQTLEKLQLQKTLESKIITASNARTALTYLETKNADAAILYKTDAVNSDKVFIIDVIPESSYDSIKYPVVIVNSSDNIELAYKYVDYLLSPEFKNTLNSYGFGK